MTSGDAPLSAMAGSQATAPESNRDEIFPKLTPEQFARVAALARERSLQDGDTLWTQGDLNPPFFVVVEGKVAILSGSDELVTVHHPGEFTGDVDLLSDRPVVVRGRARGATRVLELAPDRLRALVQTDSDLSDVFLRAFILRRLALVARGAGNVVLIGSRHSAGTLRLQDFLIRNSQPYEYVDVDVAPEVQRTLDTFGVTVDDVPVFICRGTSVLKRPTIEEVGDCLGLNRVNSNVVRDLVVVGAGPAGLSAAVYAASEGLDVLVVESSAPGGQAGSSSRIENYLGFPTGISGQRLAGLAFVQAEKFGATFAVARTVVSLECDGPLLRLDVGDGAQVQARAVVIATGVRYRKPNVPNLARFEGAGVYYAATAVEALSCGTEDVIVVGAANSAGQAAVFLGDRGRRVHMLVRGDGLAATMSRYLVRRIEETPGIEVHPHAEIEALDGDAHLESVTWRDQTGARTTARIRHVFLMIGADANAGWLPECVVQDDKGFLKTGPDLLPADRLAARWPLVRPPLLFETSLPRVFAVGDVRANSLKRVAAAVGEGSVCVQLVHKVLSE